ncbi:MAG: hypothetical protein RMM58_08155 [Chloroflexota bacterium]|nr:hypothetical protein [Dehalococcoidia bacterium]MDW8253835.1 hypothetical protein [Chloroflexota bacterium]
MQFAFPVIADAFGVSASHVSGIVVTLLLAGRLIAAAWPSAFLVMAPCGLLAIVTSLRMAAGNRPERPPPSSDADRRRAAHDRAPAAGAAARSERRTAPSS